MRDSLTPETLMYAVYFAPRGKNRLLNLGHEIAQKYLSPLDNLIGVIGDAGAGKSLLIMGIFPGLELSNDDEGVNIRPLPLLNSNESGFFSNHTYHIDVQFEMAFTQIHVLADAVKKALDENKRVIVEHFDLIYSYLERNADILVGVGEEVVVARPNICGPIPKDISDIVFKSLNFRHMAHTAEDLTCKVLEEHYGMPHSQVHGDVKHGFLLKFNEKPDIGISELEAKVKSYIERSMDICYQDDTHIRIGDEERFHCTCPRIHVRNTGDIENFRLVKKFLYDPISKCYLLIGLVGSERAEQINEINKFSIK